MTARGHRKSRRGIRNDRLNAMLRVIYDLYKAGRREEADEAYSLYDRFKTASSESEEEKLANQFSDLYCL